MNDLKGKNIIVTGASGGIGNSIIEKLNQSGANILASGTRIEKLEELKGKYGNIKTLKFDISQSDKIEEFVENATKELGGSLDCIVNNAGVTHLPTPLDEVTEEDFDRVFRINCKSVYLMAKAFVPHMKKQGNGSILNIASTAGVSPRPNLNWYNSSKGWMNTATRTMAVELAPFGVRVNAVNPVASETPLLASFLGEDTPEMRQKFLSTIPLGRFAQPEDIANAVLFLASNQSNYINGETLHVNGGMYMA